MRHTGEAYSGDGRDLIHEFRIVGGIVELPVTARLGEEVDNEGVLLPEPGVGRLKIREASNEQAGFDEQHDRQGYLRRYQGPSKPAGGPNCSGTGWECARRMLAADPPDRGEAEQQSRQ